MRIDGILESITLAVLKGNKYLLMLVQETPEKPLIRLTANTHKKEQILVAGISIFKENILGGVNDDLVKLQIIVTKLNKISLMKGFGHTNVTCLKKFKFFL